MICTYWRMIRPRALLVAALAASMALSACSGSPPVPPAGLAPPPAELMADPEALEQIPACEGDRSCRARYYARSRSQYGETADRLRGLQRWVRVAHKGTEAR